MYVVMTLVSKYIKLKEGYLKLVLDKKIRLERL